MLDSTTRNSPRGLYLLTPDCTDTAVLCARVEAALRGGALWLQYRNKQATAVLRRAQAEALKPLCEHYGVAFLINDDLPLAQAIGADGVHLGEQDLDPTVARARLGAHAIIGVSCYDRLDRADSATENGASYLAFGAFFPSPTKPTARRASPELLRAAKRFGLPRVAIGGITAENAPPLLAAGADLLAVISDVFEASDITAAAQRYAPLFQD